MVELFASAKSLLFRRWTYVPMFGYVAGTLLGLALFLIASESIPLWLPWIVIVVGLGGVFAWALLYQRTNHRLLICRFDVVSGDRGLARGVQRLVLSHLRDGLPPTAQLFTYTIAVVGRSDARHARSLARRLNAKWVLFGDILAEGGKTKIFARIAEPLKGPGMHIDDISFDATPTYRFSDELIFRLSPQLGIGDEEYPLVFAEEMEALMVGIEGQLALAGGDAQLAEELLKKGVDATRSLESHGVDSLNVEYARVKSATGSTAEAMEILRARIANNPDPSPLILRELASEITQAISLMERLVASGIGEIDEGAMFDLRMEAIEGLRAAATDLTDPLLDLTTYNLASHLLASGDGGLENEGVDVMRRLSTSSRRYRRAWYVRRALGVAAWRDADQAAQSGDSDLERRHASSAARFYSAAIRARPHFRIQISREAPILLRFATPPIMFANASDAHARAGNPFRSRMRFRQSRRRRLRLYGVAERAVLAERWAEAQSAAALTRIDVGDSLDDMATTLMQRAAKMMIDQ